MNEDGTKNPRYFTIQLRNHKDDDPIAKTLAHEMVHLKQYAKNELSKGFIVRRGSGFSIYTEWKGEVWTPKKREDPYFDSPWEVEAFGKEVGLYQRWVTRQK